MNSADLQVQGLTARRDDFQLGPLEFTVPSGCCLAIQGINGAGKTTLLEAIAGFAPIHAGGLMLCGRDITATAPERRRIAFVPQDLALFPHLSVEANVAFGLREGPRRGRDVLARLLDEFRLSHLRDCRPPQLSRGQRQRLALARALAMQPALVLLDEPSVNLDMASRESLHLSVRRLVEDYALAVLYVTHDRSEAATLADHVAILADGRLLQIGPYAEVLARPLDTHIARHLGIDNLWPARVTGRCAQGLHVEVEGRTLISASVTAPATGPLHVGLSMGEIEVMRSPPAQADNCLEVSITALETAGPLLTLMLDGPPKLRACVPAWWSRELSVGTHLWVRLPPEALRLVPQAVRAPAAAATSLAPSREVLTLSEDAAGAD